MASHLDSKNIRRIFYGIEDLMELHLAVIEGVNHRYDTPYFNNLKNYARNPIGTFHALPIARGKSVFKSHWIRDFGHFYGTNIFLAESSATTGGLDSLLEPTGNIKIAHEKAARAFGCQQLFFGTNGTSTSNKIAAQAIVRPGDIVLVDQTATNRTITVSCFAAVSRSTSMLPADRIFDVWRGAATHDQEGSA